MKYTKIEHRKGARARIRKAADITAEGEEEVGADASSEVAEVEVSPGLYV